MAAEINTLEVRDGLQWRAWLARNHSSSRGVWLVFHKRHTGIESLTYEEALHEALCFGWIDSLIKRLDDDRFVRKFTPRKPTSKWSDINRRHWAELKKSGRLAPAGLAASPTENTYAARPRVPELPAYIAQALKARPKAWNAFRALPPSHRRQFVVWIHIAKRPETREDRIRKSIAILAAGKTLGLK